MNYESKACWCKWCFRCEGIHLLIGRAKHQDKLDIYDFGVILLEVIMGKPINSTNEVEVVKDQVVTELKLQFVFCFLSKVPKDETKP